MGVVHPGSTLNPSKLELLATWLPAQNWWPAAGEPVTDPVAHFRFDDPAGEVGIETFLIATSHGIAHVPVTYRSTPLEGAELVGTLEHSALGTRWVYDATTDPVYLAEATAVISQGRHEVSLVAPDGTPIPRRATTASVRGTGPTDGRTRLQVARIVRPGEESCDETGQLIATWSGQDEPVTLARLETQAP